MSRPAHYLFGAALAATLLLGTLALRAPAARADEWFWDDPALSIHGTRVAVNIGLRGTKQEIQEAVQAAFVIVSVPESVTATAPAGAGSSYPEHVFFIHEGGWQRGEPIAVQVALFFLSRSPMDAILTVTGGGQAVSTTGLTTQGPLMTGVQLPSAPPASSDPT